MTVYQPAETSSIQNVVEHIGQITSEVHMETLFEEVELLEIEQLEPFTIPPIVELLVSLMRFLLLQFLLQFRLTWSWYRREYMRYLARSLIQLMFTLVLAQRFWCYMMMILKQ